jgi:HTH-type transcriptional regulator, sugar sensing transcriptional regulator
MELKEQLQQLDLTGKKADVYLACLELGSATVIEIAKKAGIKRTTAYDILLDLEQKGLVSQTAKGKKRLFVGEDPEKIKKDLEHKERMFSEILPMLRSVYNVRGVKPKIRYYEGIEGLKEVYSDTLKYSGEILAFASEDVAKVLGPWIENYMTTRAKRGIHFRGIIPRTAFVEKEIAPRDQQHLRALKMIDPKKYPFSIEVNIYGHSKVSLMSSKEQLGLVIESTEIYNTMKLIFELVWDNLPEMKVNRNL